MCIILCPSRQSAANTSGRFSPTARHLPASPLLLERPFIEHKGLGNLPILVGSSPSPLDPPPAFPPPTRHRTLAFSCELIQQKKLRLNEFANDEETTCVRPCQLDSTAVVVPSFPLPFLHLSRVDALPFFLPNPSALPLPFPCCRLGCATLSQHTGAGRGAVCPLPLLRSPVENQIPQILSTCELQYFQLSHLTIQFGYVPLVEQRTALQSTRGHLA